MKQGPKRTADESFHFILEKPRLESENAWAELRILKDRKTGREYLNVLYGERWKKPHIDLSIYKDGSTRYVGDRGMLGYIEKRVDSKFDGHVSTKRIQYNEKPRKGALTFKMILDDPTKTIRVYFEGLN